MHRRIEGHGVYFCRVAAAVAGQKACGFYPVSLLSLSLSFSSTTFFRISLFVPRSRSPRLLLSSLSPQRSFSLFFLLSCYASFYATAQPRSIPLCRTHFSLFLSLPDARTLSPRPFFSNVLPLPLLLPNTTTSVAFSPMFPSAFSPPPLPHLCPFPDVKPIAHASE